MSEITEQTRQYLANCSPEDLKAMLSAIYKRSRDLAPQQGSTQNAKVTKLKNIKKARIAKESTGAAKRPLNSWMGFRSFYAPIFHSHQQKDISGYLRKLWKADPFHANWTIIAKAYSIIRDDIGKQEAPLDHFLSLICPFIGIVPANEYLQRLGWACTNGESGQKELVRTLVPGELNLSENETTTHLSVEDLIVFSVKSGYTKHKSIKVPDLPALNFAARPAGASQPIQRTFSDTLTSFSSQAATLHSSNNNEMTWYSSAPAPNINSFGGRVHSPATASNSSTSNCSASNANGNAQHGSADSASSMNQDDQFPDFGFSSSLPFASLNSTQALRPLAQQPYNFTSNPAMVAGTPVIFTGSLLAFGQAQEHPSIPGYHRRDDGAYIMNGPDISFEYNWNNDESFDMHDYPGELRPAAENDLMLNTMADNDFDVYNHHNATNSNISVPAEVQQPLQQPFFIPDEGLYLPASQDGGTNPEHEVDFTDFEALVNFNSDYDSNFF